MKLFVQIQFFRTERISVNVNLLDRHLILGQGSCLIGTDNRDAPQTLYRLQLLDDGVFLCHLLRSHGLHDGYDGTECLRNRRHGQRHGKHQRVENRHFPV